jgi:hypothetical protein
LFFHCAYPCAYILFISDFTITKKGRRLGWERGVKDAQVLLEQIGSPIKSYISIVITQQ